MCLCKNYNLHDVLYIYFLCFVCMTCIPTHNNNNSNIYIALNTNVPKRCTIIDVYFS